jgi:peptidyl-prolyl cis-trans isomerase B (cyclophilin B)
MSSDEALPRVVMTTERGALTIELYANDAPKTVENFLKLVNDGFYDGLHAHRVVKDFVVQIGCPHSRKKGDRKAGTGGPGWKIKCETQGNPRRHALGALSMAHAGKDTGGSQFFVVTNAQNCVHLDGVHTVFGQVVEGLDNVGRIREWDQIVSAKVL